MDIIETEKYLDTIIAACRIIMDDDVLFNIIDPESKFLFSTSGYLNLIGQPKNYNYQYLRLDEINNRAEKVIEQILSIHQQIVSQKVTKSYLVMCDFIKDKFEIFEAEAKPILDPDNNVIAIKIIRHKYNNYVPKNYIERLGSINTQLVVPLNMPHNVNLDAREENILFLLVNGYNQYEIAEILEIPRGTVARIINSNIVEKLNIRGTSSKCIIDKAIELGYHNFIPKDLFKPQIIEIVRR